VAFAQQGVMRNLCKPKIYAIVIKSDWISGTLPICSMARFARSLHGHRRFGGRGCKDLVEMSYYAATGIKRVTYGAQPPGLSGTDK
jgi:hypothetical protein